MPSRAPVRCPGFGDHALTVPGSERRWCRTGRRGAPESWRPNTSSACRGSGLETVEEVSASRYYPPTLPDSSWTVSRDHGQVSFGSCSAPLDVPAVALSHERDDGSLAVSSAFHFGGPRCPAVRSPGRPNAAITALCSVSSWPHAGRNGVPGSPLATHLRSRVHPGPSSRPATASFSVR